MRRWIAPVAWIVAAPVGMVALWLRWPQADYPALWRQVAALVGFTAAGLCGAWAVVSFAHMRRWRDPAEALCTAGLVLMGFSFLASPVSVWLRWMPGVEAQYVAWAIRTAALLLLTPYTVGYLWRRR